MCWRDLLTVIYLIFQKSFDTGRIPADWKLAVVSPIFKKGNKCDPGNYRPVSLTSVPCKVMESMIKAEVIKHVEDSGVMSRSQHGFTRGRSCLYKPVGDLRSLDQTPRRGIRHWCGFPRFSEGFWFSFPFKTDQEATSLWIRGKTDNLDTRLSDKQENGS